MYVYTYMASDFATCQSERVTHFVWALVVAHWYAVRWFGVPLSFDSCALRWPLLLDLPRVPHGALIRSHFLPSRQRNRAKPRFAFTRLISLARSRTSNFRFSLSLECHSVSVRFHVFFFLDYCGKVESRINNSAYLNFLITLFYDTDFFIILRLIVSW